MMDAAETPRDGLIIHILYKTGLRVHELTSLMIEHIEFDKNQLMVVSGKRDRDRWVDIDDELKCDILYYIGTRKTGILFLSRLRRGGDVERMVVRQGYRKKDGKIVDVNKKEITLQPRQMSDRSIAKIIKSLSHKVGITKAKTVTPHTLRHTYACQSLLSGVSLPSIQKSMGHSSIATTQVYLEAVQDRKHVKKDYEAHPLPQVAMHGPESEIY